MEDFSDNNFNNQDSGFECNNEQTNKPEDAAKDDIMKVAVPYSGLILALGILSIASICCCVGFIAPVFSIIALILANKSKKEFEINNDLYTAGSMSKVSTGKTCAIIGLVFGIIAIILLAIAYGSVNDVSNLLKDSSASGWNQLGY